MSPRALGWAPTLFDLTGKNECPLPGTASRQQLYSDLAPIHLTPFWECLHALVPPKPLSLRVPALLVYEQIRSLLFQAGEAITAEEAVRGDDPFGLSSLIFSYSHERSREVLEKLERDAPLDD